jgi:hypothetical protein
VRRYPLSGTDMRLDLSALGHGLYGLRLIDADGQATITGTWMRE